MEAAFAASITQSSPEPHPLVKQYAEQLSASLACHLTQSERDLAIDEAIFVLERAISDRILAGEPESQAVEAALAEFGSPTSIAEAHIEGAYEREGRSLILRLFGRANAVAFGVFGCATLVYLVWLQIRLYFPAANLADLRLSPLAARTLVPEPLPFPEPSLAYALTMVYPLVVPLACGWIVGALIPSRAHVAVYRTLLPIIVASFLTGSLLLPVTEGLLFATVQTVFWLPVGPTMALVSSRFHRHRRLRPCPHPNPSHVSP